MDAARSQAFGANRLAGEDFLTKATMVPTATIESETGRISASKFAKPGSGAQCAADDNGNHQIQAAGVPQITTTANNTTAKTSTNACGSSSSSNINSLLLLRRRRLKRNVSAAATTTSATSASSTTTSTSTSSSFSSGGNKTHTGAPPGPSSSLSTRSLDRKVVLLRQRLQTMQLQPADREWVRADLQRGCVHVHDRAAPSHLRPVLCTLGTGAGETARRLGQVGSKGGSVLRVIGKGGGLGSPGGSPSPADRPTATGTAARDTAASVTPAGSAMGTRLPLSPNDDDSQNHQDINGFAPPGSLLDGVAASAGKSSGVITVHLGHNNAESLVDEESDSRHNGAGDSCGLNSGSDVDSSTCDDLSSGAQLGGHRDSLSDGMVLGTEASILRPPGDRATEGLDPFASSSSDELELDCTTSGLAIDSIIIAQRLERLRADNTTTSSSSAAGSSGNSNNHDDAVNGRLCGGELSNCAEEEEGLQRARSGQEALGPGERQFSSSNSLSRPLTGSAAVRHGDPKYPGCVPSGSAAAERGPFTPTLYVQMHGEAARRLGQDERPLQIQNDYLCKLGFKDPWRVQEEGMDSEIGCLIRFFAGAVICSGGTNLNLSALTAVSAGSAGSAQSGGTLCIPAGVRGQSLQRGRAEVQRSGACWGFGAHASE
ncbi:hypothetical protein AAFF_G00318030 [Aldrovandia affinis]|uniref:PHLPP-like RA domain-containing protein n=1 Tax=Aldrovandia affinis TaxID=143900 RepID=A0AAD7R713_9TELE|nr:hypothetical protein AAFF_G00318030 [Aldrovandia affinis]